MPKIVRSYFYILICLFLSSCVHTRPVTNVTPTCTTKPANKTQYCVYGKKYSVLKSSKHYEAKGVASWYGKSFNHKQTSNGERYNMYKYTAAHKTLPFSTRLLVTNLLNGKQVVVRVNDRGPFVGSRLIDLSYAAAKKIGIANRGVAKVSIKAIPKTQLAHNKKRSIKHRATHYAT